MTEQSPPNRPHPPEVLQTLAVKWMKSFEMCARSENRKGIMGLFDPTSLICGSQKDGPLDNVMSKNFHFETDAAKMIPHSPTVLVVVPWHALSQVHGGPTRKGDCTFYFALEEFVGEKSGEVIKQKFVCYHAHFSMV